MNEVESAIESCRARHGKFLGDYQRDISDAHRRKLEKQMQIEQVKISALEKQIPKKPLNIKMLFVPHSTLIKSVYGKCPICDTVQADDEYCQHCGQALDWRNEDE